MEAFNLLSEAECDGRPPRVAHRPPSTRRSHRLLLEKNMLLKHAPPPPPPSPALQAQLDQMSLAQRFYMRSATRAVVHTTTCRLASCQTAL